MNTSNRMALKTNSVVAPAAVLSVGILLASSPQLSANESLNLDTYLDQVRTRNTAILGAQESSDGAELRSKDAELIFTPNLNLDANLVDDKKPSLFIPTITGTINNTYSLGVYKAFAATGTQAKVAYNLAFVRYVGMPNTGFHIASTQVELRQPLLRGFLGAETRANAQQLRADAFARKYESRFQLKLALAEAESAYWRLNTASQAVKIQREALLRAERILELNTQRARLQLSDRADVLQAEALVETRRLEVQAAQDEERSARLAFNSARGVESDVVTEALAPIDSELLARAKKPQRSEIRDDVRAAQEREQQANALATLGIERNKPSIDLYGSYALNGQTAQLSDALSNSFSNTIPTRIVGVKVAVPLDFLSSGASTSDARAGYRKEQLGAELVAQRKLFDQEREWQDLSQRFEEAKRRYELSRAIEAAQGRKLEYEKLRLQRGRSTTFQVLLMETDYLVSQLGRLRTQAEVLNLIARMKLFSNDSTQNTAATSTAEGARS